MSGLRLVGRWGTRNRFRSTAFSAEQEHKKRQKDNAPYPHTPIANHRVRSGHIHQVVNNNRLTNLHIVRIFDVVPLLQFLDADVIPSCNLR